MNECIILIVVYVIVLLILGLCFSLKKVKNFTKKDPMLVELHAVLCNIDPAAKKITVSEENKSYTVNKKDVFLCLKDKDGEYYNKNFLIFVAIHELSHVICPSIGHTDEFWKINEKLLNKATALGYYNPSIPVVKDYIDSCGTH
tara:strand:+ start:194 stop:625 length:432 start_codon:yes stop_codon:yes gene_type:complete